MRRVLYIVLLVLGLALLPACSKRDERIEMTEYVMIYAGTPIVELPGKTRDMSVLVRNVSPNKLTKLRLQVKSEVCRGKVAPATIDQLIPGERATFTITLTRTSAKAHERYPLALTLYAEGLPVPAGVDLMVDMGQPVDNDGWIDVGQVTLVRQEQSRLVYYILAGTPLVLVLGWLLWRWSRPRSRRGPRGPRQQDGDEAGTDRT